MLEQDFDPTLVCSAVNPTLFRAAELQSYPASLPSSGLSVSFTFEWVCHFVTTHVIFDMSFACPAMAVFWPFSGVVFAVQTCGETNDFLMLSVCNPAVATPSDHPFKVYLCTRQQLRGPDSQIKNFAVCRVNLCVCVCEWLFPPLIEGLLY